MQDEDQAVRKQLNDALQTGAKPDPALVNRMLEIDAKHTARMKEIVGAHGWPTVSAVGEPGAFAAWLLVQHADADVPFQREALELMLAAAPGEVSAKNVAYLTDRVLLAEGKKQRYGTQVELINCEYQPRPLEDESKVDELRATVGLEPLAEYLSFFKVPPDCKPE